MGVRTQAFSAFALPAAVAVAAGLTVAFVLVALGQALGLAVVLGLATVLACLTVTGLLALARRSGARGPRVQTPSRPAAPQPAVSRTVSSGQVPGALRGGSDMAAGLRALAERVRIVEERLDALQAATIERSQATIRAVAAELDVVGTVMRDLAEAVAQHDAELFALAPQPEPPAPLQGAASLSEAQGRAENTIAASAALRERESSLSGPEPVPEASAPQADLLDPRLLTLFDPLDESRLELHLQPVMALPQRKMRLYEAMHYFRSDTETLVPPRHLRAVARLAGCDAQIGRLLVRRARQVVAHLAGRQRDAALLCHVSEAFFVDKASFAEAREIAAAGEFDTRQLILALDQATLRGMDVLAREGLAALRDLGYRFLLDGTQDLKLDPRQLFEQGFRHVRLAAPLLLDPERAQALAEIHPADLAGLLARAGISLIVDGVDEEALVPELLDYAVPLAQGALFGAPRAVRSEVLEARPLQPEAEPAPKPTPVRGSFRASLRRATA